MSKTRRGFTLVELLAVIVILAVILVIAVPQIMNVITESRKGALISSAKLIASAAETAKLSNDTLGINKTIKCEDVSKLNSEDYDSCTITFDSNGKAKVTIVGKGKFEGMSVCEATKEDAEISSECIIPTNTACFTYEEIQQVSNFDINKDVCKTFFSQGGAPVDKVETICAGGEIDGYTMKDYINLGYFSASALEKSVVISNVQYSESVISITDYDETCPKDVIIPREIDNKTVVEIGYGAFADESIFAFNEEYKVEKYSVLLLKNKFYDLNAVPIEFEAIQLTSVTIPDSVTSIGEYAFYGNQLTSVIIPDSVTYIGKAAFNDNKLSDNDAYIYKRNSDGSIDNTYVVSYGGAKKDITIPNSVVTIGEDAFSSNQLTNVTIPNSVTTICPYAFADNQLTSVIIPNSVTAIGDSAFYENQITSVTIGNSVTTIGRLAFDYNLLTSVIIPNSVTAIGYGAFYKSSDSNPNLTSIINTTGRSFDWSYIITGSSGTTAVTGTYNGVNVTTE